MSYFGSIASLKDLERQHKKLARKYHPDINPDGIRIMQAVNAEYELLKKRFKKVETKVSAKRTERHDSEACERKRIGRVSLRANGAWNFFGIGGTEQYLRNSKIAQSWLGAARPARQTAMMSNKYTSVRPNGFHMFKPVRMKCTVH